MSATWLVHGRARAAVLVLVALLAFAAIRPGTVAGQAGPDYVVTLSGSEQVPEAVETDATGLFTATWGEEGLNYTLQVSGSGLVQAHIHLGPAGANGPVIAFLFALEEEQEPVDEIDVTGTITVEDLLADLEGDWDGFLAALATNNLYVNVHSGEYPAGELRGQIVSSYDVTLTGAEQVPEPVETEATGLFRASYNAETDTLDYELVVDGDDFVQAHIHLGAAGANGPVVAFLFALEEEEEPVDHIHAVGSIGVNDLLADLEGDWDGFLAALGGGNLYANVHSAAFPAGELRGQIVPQETSEPEPEPLAIGVTEDEELGDYLVGPDGLTLYIFTVDEPGVSNCSGPCADAWPPLTVAAGQSIAPAEGIPGEFGMIEREDGSHQVTYNGAPLYYFAGDTAPGDTTGQGVNDVWFVASVQEGAEPTPTAEPTEEPTEAPTEEPTEAPTEAPTATPTEEPTVAPTTVPPTNTPVAPAPPDAGSAGVTGAGGVSIAMWLLALLGLAAIGFGASTIFAVNRR